MRGHHGMGRGGSPPPAHPRHGGGGGGAPPGDDSDYYGGGGADDTDSYSVASSTLRHPLHHHPGSTAERQAAAAALAAHHQQFWRGGGGGAPPSALQQQQQQQQQQQPAPHGSLLRRLVPYEVLAVLALAAVAVLALQANAGPLHRLYGRGGQSPHSNPALLYSSSYAASRAGGGGRSGVGSDSAAAGGGGVGTREGSVRSLLDRLESSLGLLSGGSNEYGGGGGQPPEEQPQDPDAVGGGGGVGADADRRFDELAARLDRLTYMLGLGASSSSAPGGEGGGGGGASLLAASGLGPDEDEARDGAAGTGSGPADPLARLRAKLKARADALMAGGGAADGSGGGGAAGGACPEPEPCPLCRCARRAGAAGRFPDKTELLALHGEGVTAAADAAAAADSTAPSGGDYYGTDDLAASERLELLGLALAPSGSPCPTGSPAPSPVVEVREVTVTVVTVAPCPACPSLPPVAALAPPEPAMQCPPPPPPPECSPPPPPCVSQTPMCTPCASPTSEPSPRSCPQYDPREILPFPPLARGKVVFISYGDRNFQRSLARITSEAKRWKVFDKVLAYTPAHFSKAYKRANAALLAMPRGGGYWAWKSYFIWKTMQQLDYGDIVFYNDAGSTIRRDPTPYVDLAAKYGGLTFRIGYKTASWTKGIVFDALGLPMGVYGPQPMIAAGTIVLQKRPHTVKLIQEFMRLSQNISLISDEDTSRRVANHPQFNEHRHDQSLWTLLCYKYGFQLVLQGGAFPEDGAIVSHTRVHG